MPKEYKKTEGGKLMVSETIQTESIQEYTREDLEQNLAQCEASLETLKGHIKFYKDLLKEADKAGVIKVKNQP